jgi:dihydrofolate synthase/folylpolyglutamate synthase
VLAHGQHWQVWEERDRLVFQDETGLLDLPLPALIGAHQVQNAGAALAALRCLGFGEEACAAAMTDVTWPARMQRLRHGPLAEAAAGCELWLDGGHNPAAGEMIAGLLSGLAPRPTHLVCGMLNTKDVAGFLRPLAGVAASLTAVSIPGETATLSAEDTAEIAAAAGHQARAAEDVATAVRGLAAENPGARIVICGSLYLAGQVLRDNG